MDPTEKLGLTLRSEYFSDKYQLVAMSLAPEGANIFANTFIANTGGYIQFADGTKQYTANAGGSSGPTGNSFGVIYTSNNSTFANAITANDQVTFIGVDGVTVNANATTKTITFAGTPGAQGLTVDYGLVTESLAYSLDYGTL